MRLIRPQGAATGGTEPRVSRRHLGAGAIRMLSVTAVAAATCSLWVGAASAATAAPAAGAATTTTITNPADGTVTSGDAFTFNVTVTGGAAAPTGTVDVTAIEPTGLSPAYSCSVTLAAGAGSCTIHPPAYGVVEYQAVYSGDGTHAGSTSATYYLAVQNLTTTTITSPDTAKAGSVTLVADVNAGGANISNAAGGTGSVTFYSGTAVIKGCAAEALGNPTGGADNLAECATTFAAGTYDITAKYSGDTTNVASQGSQTLAVEGASPPPAKHATKTSGSASPNRTKVHRWVRLSASVTSSGTPTGRVTFIWRGHVVCRASLSHGRAHCSVKFSRARRYWIRAYYSGNSTHSSSHSRLFEVKVKA